MKIQSYSDIITNSSSELFVFKNNLTAPNIIAFLNKNCPGWQNEYQKPKAIKNASKDLLGEYLAFECLGYDLPTIERKWKASKFHHQVNRVYDEDEFDPNDCWAKEFAESLGNSPDKVFKNWDLYNPFMHSYCIGGVHAWLHLSNEGYQLYKKKYGDIVLMRSIGENPRGVDIDEIAKNYIDKRIHLG